MRRSVQPNCPRAMTCCFLASLKMFAMPAEGRTAPPPRQRLERLLPMAGFQVSIYGRFWVSTEDAGRSFVVALPTIANTLHADILGISWAIIAYQLPRISLSVVFGRLGDIH